MALSESGQLIYVFTILTTNGKYKLELKTITKASTAYIRSNAINSGMIFAQFIYTSAVIQEAQGPCGPA